MLIVPVERNESGQFRKMLVDYWHSLLPQAPFLRDPILAEAMFSERYRWGGGSNNPLWIIVDDRRVGFLMDRIYRDHSAAYIHDFYIEPPHRRKGHGSQAFRQMLATFEDMGLSRIELSVLVDNKAALDFWERHQFEIAYHRLTRVIRLDDEGLT